MNHFPRYNKRRKTNMKQFKVFQIYLGKIILSLQYGSSIKLLNF